MVLDEPKETDSIYDMGSFKFIIDKREEKDAPYLEIDYQSFWFGKELLIRVGC